MVLEPEWQLKAVELFLPEEDAKEEKNFLLPMKENLTKNERLGKKSDLNKIFAKGSVSKCHGAKILFLRNPLSYSRFAITIVRKFGNAVERNYTKRIFRDFFRTHKQEITESCDIVVVVYPGDFSYQNRLDQFNLLMKRANLVKNH